VTAQREGVGAAQIVNIAPGRPEKALHRLAESKELSSEIQRTCLSPSDQALPGYDGIHLEIMVNSRRVKRWANCGCSRKKHSNT
jgi:hypothetical protein